MKKILTLFVALSAIPVSVLSLSTACDSSDDDIMEQGTDSDADSDSDADVSQTWESATPDNCRAEEVGTTVTAAASPYNYSCVEGTAPLTVALDPAGKIVSVNAVSCTYFFAGVAAEYPGCEQYFQCGSCQYLLRTELAAGNWELVITDGECPAALYCGFVLGLYNAVPDDGSTDDGGNCGEPCPSGCCSPSGASCCEPPFCGGDCVGSPCC